MQAGWGSGWSLAMRRWMSFFLGLFLLGSFPMAPRGQVLIRSERWRWSNPFPHGNNVQDMFITPDLSMQVGDGGGIYVRKDDARWVPAGSWVTNYMRGAARLGDRLLAVGEKGCILWSDDGRVFNAAHLYPVTADWFEGVAADSLCAVAVGDNGAIYTSPDGVVWTRSVSGTMEWMRGVAAGNGEFVAVGEYGTVLRSTTGTDWNRIESGTDEHLNRVRYLGTAPNTRFIAVGEHGMLLSSPSGLGPWTVLSSGTTNDLFDVALNDEGLLVVGDQEIRFQPHGENVWVDQIHDPVSNTPPAWGYLCAGSVSNDWLVAGRTGLMMEGVSSNGWHYTWNASEDSSYAWIWDVTMQRGICVAVGDLAHIQTSLDGIRWAREVVPVSDTNTVLLGVGGTSNLLLAVGTDGTMLVSPAGQVEVTVTNDVDGLPVETSLWVEALGVVWSNIPAFTAHDLQGVAAREGLFLACGADGSLFASSNGLNWDVRATPVPHFLSGVAIGPTACVAVGANGTLLTAAPDGTGWSAVPLATDHWIYHVRWIDNRFVAVGEAGSIYTSPDGISWTARTSGTSRWLTDVTNVEGRWFVTGFQGTLLSSSNLEDWSRLPLPTIKSLFGACSLDGRLVVAGIEGIILRNQVVPIESSVDILSYTPAWVTLPDSTRGLREAFVLRGAPDQFFEFQSATNLLEASWRRLETLEIYDPSGILHFFRFSSPSDMPQTRFYQTRSFP